MNFAMPAKPNMKQQNKDVMRGDEGGGRHQNGGEKQQLHHERQGVRALIAILLYKALSQNGLSQNDLSQNGLSQNNYG